MTPKWVVRALVVALVPGGLALTGRKAVDAERVIPHSPGAIWVALMDTGRYGEWNPIFVSADGRFEEGGTVRYRMKTRDGGTTPVEPLVRRLVGERELNHFGMRGVLTFDHTWRLEPVAGGTRVTQHEVDRGIGVWFWDPAWVEAAYREALAAALGRHLAG